MADQSKASVDTPTAEDRRFIVRQSVLKSAKIVYGQSVVDCFVMNVSETGVRVRTDAMMPVPERVTLRFSGGAVFSAVRRWALGTEIGFSFEDTASLNAASMEAAWQIHEMVRATTLEEPIRLLRAERFFDDLTLQTAAQEAEAGLRRFETALAALAKRLLP